MSYERPLQLILLFHSAFSLQNFTIQSNWLYRHLPEKTMLFLKFI
ncbi:hypothetical protein CKA32_005534 [Geitlerinema sp. FC II]|nr:hypothetical protein CKA32_005534 [Geitlerinema sp. FC II]